MRFPDREDILQYVEGAQHVEGPVQKQIFQLMASNAVLREQIAELRKDLYEVETQIPDFSYTETFDKDLRGLAQTWLKLSYDRKNSFQLFYKNWEFWKVFLYLFGVYFLFWAVLRFFHKA